MRMEMHGLEGYVSDLKKKTKTKGNPKLFLTITII